MSNAISKDFKFFSLLRFAFPTVIMMIFMSLYTIVDGIFMARFIGSNALSASNIVYPVVNVLMAAGIMLSTGGSAVIAAKMGEGRQKEANENLSLIVLSGLVIGFVGLIACNLFKAPLSRLLGATDLLLPYCTDYMGTLMLFAPMCMLQLLFQAFFVTAGRPGLGLMLTMSGGIANMVLDYVFMGPLQMGVAGAALATGIGQSIPAVVGLIYFSVKKSGLHFGRPRLDLKVLGHSCFNGSSEMVTNLSTALVTFLFNQIMLRLAGETGVAAISAVLYGQFLFVALYLGFSMGVAPVFSFNFGLKNRVRLQKLYRISITFVLISSVLITLFAFFGSPFIAGIFMEHGSEGYELTKRGGYLFSLNYLFAGTNILASGIFTALSDGKTSAIISFLRTFVFIVAAALTLPFLMGGTDGVWLSIPAAEALTMFVSVPKLVSYFRDKR